MAEKHAVIINHDKCIGCGSCVKDCVGSDLQLVNGKAIANGKSCIYCGHCQAVCPVNAVEVTGFEDEIEEFETQTRLDPNELLKALKTRRTIRQFTNEKVSKEVLDMILEAGRVTATAANSQKLKFVVLQDNKDEAEKLAVGMFRGLVETGKKVISQLSNMNISDDFFFKKAPVVIVVVSSDKVSSSLAAENMALMAEANGLGVLFSGFFTTCVNTNRKIKKMLGLSSSEKAVTTMVIGYPNVKYHRTTHRNKLNVIYK